MLATAKSEQVIEHLGTEWAIVKSGRSIVPQPIVLETARLAQAIALLESGMPRIVVATEPVAIWLATQRFPDLPLPVAPSLGHGSVAMPETN